MPEVVSKGIVPLADMFNHDFEEKQLMYFYDNDNNGFVVEALWDIKKGETLCINYNEMRGNTHFFLNYGFINEADEANDVILFGMLIEDLHSPFYEIKRELMEPGFCEQIFRITFNYDYE